MTEHPEAVLRALWAAGGRTTTTEQMFDWLYADDPDGGPPRGRMYANLRAAIETVNTVLAGTLQIVPIGNRRGRWRLRISI
ncbi:hypothetical protein [Yoonia sp. TsM2_T14_4]|uniref:hypothetical protein n=1 Tax=Yoonia sp. TsM2_T14_4 TaxID=3415141 RepID=UPI003C76E417